MKKRNVVIAVSVAGGLLVCLLGICLIGVINGPKKDADASSSKPPAPTSQAATSQAAPRPTAATQAAPKKYSDTAKFPTGRYADEVRVKIDDLFAAKDCKGLQAEFDKADANDAAQRDRTGSGTTDLMQYIDGAQKAAGCH